MQLIIVEDIGYRNLLPLTATRPVFDLLCGTLSLADRIRSSLPSPDIRFIMRDDFYTVFPEYVRWIPDLQENSEYSLFINGRVILDESLASSLRKITRRKESTYVHNGSDWVAVYLTTSEMIEKDIFLSDTVQPPYGVSDHRLDAHIVSYPWDLIDVNKFIIDIDFRERVKRLKNKLQGKIHPRAVLSPKKNIFVGKNSTIHPNVVIDASDGVVMIESDVEVEPNVYIHGPVWINSKTRIKAGARIYGSTSIGYCCRVGGEVTSSIIHSYTNKGHEGFLGNSYLGQWINIGADTNNSNLKNNYGSISVVIDGKAVETGKQFFGMVVGDHSRTGINTMINTGTIIGVGCNIFGASFPPKFIPDFSWGGNESLVLYKFDKFLESANAMTGRRNVSMSDSEIELLRKIYESRKSRQSNSNSE